MGGAGSGYPPLVFIYPVFWTEAPAILVGWFNRVWTYGIAYGENKSMQKPEEALVLCVTGRTVEHLEEYGHLESMRKVMFGDRLHDRVGESEMVVFDGTSRADMELRKRNWSKHLKTAYKKGFEL